MTVFFPLSCCIPSTYPLYTTTFVGEVTIFLSVFSHFPMVSHVFQHFSPQFSQYFSIFQHLSNICPTFSHIFPWFPNSQCLHGREAEAGPRPRRATGFGDEDQARARRAQVGGGTGTFWGLEKAWKIITTSLRPSPGIMASKEKYPQMALIQVGEIL